MPVEKCIKVTPESIKQLEAELTSKGISPKTIEALNDILGKGKNGMEKAGNLAKGTRTLNQQGSDVLVELYRSMLLSNFKTHATNVLSGAAETFIVPLTRLTGQALTLDTKGAMETLGFIKGVGMGFRESFSMAAKSIFKEQNFLDPIGTKIDATGNMFKKRHAISMELIDPTKSEWNMINWATALVNTTGKIARTSLRLLGGEDEFFKQLNYRGHAYQRIMKEIDVNTTPANRKAYIEREMAKYFNASGEATDKGLLQYSREITFSEDLRRGSLADNIQKLLNKTPYAQVFIPFFRTPANIFTRFIERTPGVNLMLPKVREMWHAGGVQRQQVIGNMTLGMGMYYMALDDIISGNVTGAGPSDPDVNKLWRNAGNQPYSIKVNTPGGVKWISYSRMEPIMLPYVFAASIVENAHTYNLHRDEFDSVIGRGLVGFMKAVTDRSYLQNFAALGDTIHGISGARGYDPTSGLQRIALNFIPSALGQVEDIRNYYKGAEQGILEAITFEERFRRRLGPLNEMLPGSTNAVKHNWITGEKIVSPYGTTLGIPIENSGANPVIQEIVRMGRSIDPPDTKIGNVELTGKQYARLSELVGTLSDSKGNKLMDYLDNFMQTEDYKKLSGLSFDPDYEDYRVTGVKKIMNRFKQIARKKLINEDSELRDKILADRINKARGFSGYRNFFKINE